ncbi:MAG: MurR/RpiR family transcriptional regulator [Eubacteriales bacterium]
MQDILKTIDAAAPSLSKGQKLIAAFIQNHYDKAAYMTASRLGAEVGVSESTVVRFATELGYDGYPALQRAIQETVRMRLTSLQRIEVANHRLGGANILDAVLASDAEKIKYTLEHIDRAAFERALDALLGARTIYIIGMRSSSPLAEFLNYYLSYMFENVRLIRTTSGSEIFEQLMRIGPQDVLLAVSFPRYSTRIVNAVDYARQAGACIVSLTDSPHSPIARDADAVLCARSDMASFIDSLVAPLSIINALLAALAQKKQAELAATLTKLENVWDTFHVYDKSSGAGQEAKHDE